MKIKHLLLPTIAAICLSCGGSKQKTTEEEVESNNIGAYKMPYLRYDSQEAEIGGAAVRETAPDYDRRNTASEASNQEYVALKDTGSFISWTINENTLLSAKTGVTLRFTLPDASTTLSNRSGESVGQKSDIDIYVNCIKKKTVTLDSRWAWQYFVDMDSDPKTHITDYAMMRFDEVHFLLSDSLKVGDTIKIVKSKNDNLTTGIDFIEIESVPMPIAKPENALSVKDFGAKGDGIADDWGAINATIKEALKTGKTVYIPEGTFRIDTLMKLDQDGINIQGAGMWYTKLFFSNNNKMKAAVCGNASRLRLADLYINGVNTLRQEADKSYRDQKGIWGNWGESSVIENVWVEHFECGIWTAGYAHTPPLKAPTKNLRISNVRLRNQYADGVNFAEGTSLSVFEHSNVRNCGDDGIASWSQTASKTTPCNQGNTFRYNTVELGWRAGAIGIFGGGGHHIHHCYVGEHLLSAGIRFTADFPGCPLDTDPANKMYVHDCIIYKCGTPSDLFHDRLSAIDIHGGKQYPLDNITFENIEIISPQTDGIQIWGGNINNTSFKNIKISGVTNGYDIASRLDKAERRKDILLKEQTGSAVFENVTKEKVYNDNEVFELKFK
ncbi:MAG: right-handed parallel beta-helix repeat-containing protein [Prevotellaceae bacterium]|jgi:hypothetical protein|nr:right-handed parallel beta-helix repeat-containing protein [Prevotellaceae bacterium]